MKNIKNLLIYAAGYIDGDGCLYIGKYTVHKNKSIVYERSIQVVSVKKAVLIVFQSNFGGFILKKPFKARHRDAYCWSLKGPESLFFAESIKEFLIEKTYQCDLFIQFCQHINKNKNGTLNTHLINQREIIIENSRKDKHMSNLITQEEVESVKKEAFTITPSNNDFIYLAGLIDSEGCFRVKKSKPKNKPNHVYHIGVEIGNSKLPIIPWLIKRFGGGIAFIEAKKNKKAFAVWSLSAKALYEILPRIRPYLTIKQEVCDKLIEFQQTIISNGGDRHSLAFKAMFEKRIEVRERIVQEIHSFNHKGSI